jgi:hypothetical protein
MDGEAAWEKQVVVSYQEPFHEELLHFHRCLTAGEEPATGIEQAVKDTETMIAMALACRG